MSKKNSNLHAAKKAKNDEFYTMISDIEKEIWHYREFLQGKTIFLNCDDDTKSNFWKFFKLNAGFLGLKKVIGTHFNEEKPTHKIELFKKEDGDFIETITPLNGNGDFRSPECVSILDECDVVITNPPFSLFREFVNLLVEKNKKFLIVGNLNAISYKEIFPLIKDNKLWLGINNGSKTYQVPDWFEGKCDLINGEKFVTLGNTGWFTNINHGRRNEKIDLFVKFSEDKYPSYDNYDAIEVSRVSEIPVDYTGVMGVPITFLTKYNPNQFVIEGFRKGDDGKDLRYTLEDGSTKEPYFRILIKHK